MALSMHKSKVCAKGNRLLSRKIPLPPARGRCWDLRGTHGGDNGAFDGNGDRLLLGLKAAFLNHLIHVIFDGPLLRYRFSQ